MAQRVEVIFEYDIDGSPADETVQFALNGLIRDRSLGRERASSGAGGSEARQVR